MSKSKNNITDALRLILSNQLQTQAMLDKIGLLATETKEQKEARKLKEEIERDAYKWVHGGGTSTHGPI